MFRVQLQLSLLSMVSACVTFMYYYILDEKSAEVLFLIEITYPIFRRVHVDLHCKDPYLVPSSSYPHLNLAAVLNSCEIKGARLQTLHLNICEFLIETCGNLSSSVHSWDGNILENKQSKLIAASKIAWLQKILSLVDHLTVSNPGNFSTHVTTQNCA